jgi:hypothetical protein
MLNQDPFTKMVERKELGWFGHQIGWTAIGSLSKQGNKELGRGTPRIEWEGLMMKLTREEGTNLQ